MNHKIPTHILREMVEAEENQERYHEFMGRKIREFNAEEKQASVEREKANNK